MIAQYLFDVDTAELLVVRRWHRGSPHFSEEWVRPPRTCTAVGVTVEENTDAARDEFVRTLDTGDARTLLPTKNSG